MLPWGSVDICVCTFRRDSLEATLRSIAGQILPEPLRLRAVVVDNDDTPTARDLAERVCAECDLPLLFVHAPARNISIARNACLSHAEAPLVAFIDDDETAEPGWLAALIETLERDGADVVLGPVKAIYDADGPAWVREADLHSTRPVFGADGAVLNGYTCNVLLKRSLLGAAPEPRFIEALGRSGGEDTVFFQELREAGARTAFSEDAIVREIVPPQRRRMAWLISRSFRMGQTHGWVLERGLGVGNLPGRSAAIALASAKMTFSLGATLLGIGSVRRWRRQLIRAALHAGVIAKLCGMTDVTLY
jgi:succinoglycan biosynthesis protein ExoM